jgi:hypothetical protein
MMAAFRTASGSSTLTTQEERAVRAVNDPAAFRAYTQREGQLGVRLTACSRGEVVQEAGRPPFTVGCTMKMGAVMLFPTDPTFQWSDPTANPNWHGYELVDILDYSTPELPNQETYLLASCGLSFPLSGGDVCFRRTGPHKITMPFLPETILIPDDPSAMRANRLRMERLAEAPIASPGSSAPGSSGTSCLPSTSLTNDGGPSTFAGNTGSPSDNPGNKSYTDPDGFTRQYLNPAAQASLLGMQGYWRFASAERLRIFVPRGQFCMEIWDSCTLQFAQFDAPVDADPSSKVLYEADKLRRAVVLTDPNIKLRACTLEWARHDWTSLSILHFLLNPSQAQGIVIVGSIEQEVRDLFLAAIQGWQLWMSIYFNPRYAKTFPRTLHWLANPPQGRTRECEGSYLRHVIENVFSSLYAAATLGGTVTRFNGVSFSRLGAIFDLITALDEELVTLTVVADPFPHALFQYWLGVRTIKGLNDTSTPKTQSTPALSLVPGPRTTPSLATPHPGTPLVAPGPPPASGAAVTSPAGPTCGFHMAFLLKCGGHKGPTPCSRGTLCSNAHRALDAMTVEEAREVCYTAFTKGGPIRDACLEAILAHPDLFM